MPEEHARDETATPTTMDTDTAASVGGGMEDEEYERKLVRKLDMNIVPVVMLLYLLSFLDR